MDSIDTSHVPPPDPAFYWEFVPNRTVILAASSPYVSLRLRRIKLLGMGSAEFTLTIGDKKRIDWLHLDRPCVALRMADGIEPAITITLRELRDGKAFLQVTAHPCLRQMKRSALEQ